MHKIILICLSLNVLVACGGGGSDSSPGAPATSTPATSSPTTTPTTSVPTTSTPTPVVTSPAPLESSPPSLFKTLSSILPDSPADYVNELCEQPETAIVIPVAINDDNYDDFIIHAWCPVAYEDFGIVLTEPTKDMLFGFLSNEDGTYTLNNQAIFGESLPRLGGASRKYAAGDVNGDGVDDYAFAMNNEDGRNGEVPEYMGSQPGVIISQANGTYKAMAIPTIKITWGHSVNIVDNFVGSKDILHGGLTNGRLDNGDYYKGFTAWRYIDNEFVEVTQEYPDENITAPWGTEVKFWGLDENTELYAAGESDNITDGYGISMHKKNSDGQWIRGGDWHMTTDYTLSQYCSWNTNKDTCVAEGLAYEMPFDYMDSGIPFIGGNYDQLCTSDTNLDGEPIKTLFAKSAMAVYLGDDFDPEMLLHESDFTPMSTITVFEVRDDQLVKIQEVDDAQTKNSLYFDCADFNADGLPDLVVREMHSHSDVDIAGIPTVVVNNNGILTKVDTSEWPTLIESSPYSQSASGFLHDIDNDGLPDLMMHQVGKAQYFTPEGDTVIGSFNPIVLYTNSMIGVP